MTHVDELLKKLTARTFQRKVRKWGLDTCWMMDWLHDGGDGGEFGKGDWGASVDYSLDQHGRSDELFRDVVDGSATLCLASAKELGEAFDAWFSGQDRPRYDAFDELYPGFLNYLRIELLRDRQFRMELCALGTEESRLRTKLEQVLSCAEWGKYGADRKEAEILGRPLPPPPTNSISIDEKPAFPQIVCRAGDVMVRVFCSPGNSMIHGELLGPMSPGVFSQLTDTIQKVLPSIFRTINLLRPPDDDISLQGHRSRTGIAADYIDEHRGFIEGCVDSLLAANTRKDTTRQRCRNATMVLALADRQGHRAIGLALSATALEALLGLDHKKRNKESITSTLAAFVPALLEPVRSHWRKCDKFVKKLYDLRSRTLHGENLDEREAMTEKARTLAACCLHALWSWQDFKRRRDEKDVSVENLLDDLRDANLKERQLEGVPEEPAAWALWR